MLRPCPGSSSLLLSALLSTLLVGLVFAEVLRCGAVHSCSGLFSVVTLSFARSVFRLHPPSYHPFHSNMAILTQTPVPHLPTFINFPATSSLEAVGAVDVCLELANQLALQKTTRLDKNKVNCNAMRDASRHSSESATV